MPMFPLALHSKNWIEESRVLAERLKNSLLIFEKLIVWINGYFDSKCAAIILELIFAIVPVFILNIIHVAKV
ncbi:hypothetical protein E2320_019979 [Naja naja]|nr:hypothetical protein E2320_019979 [Naja naja]